MKSKKTILLIIGVIIVAATLGLLLHELLIERVTKYTETTLLVEEGCTLHTDATVKRGSIHLLIEGEDGSTYFDGVLDSSYNNAIESFRTETYVVHADYQNAAGRMDVYITEKNGNRVNG